MTLPPLTDEQIAAHEAGHALAAHLMGESIAAVHTYMGEQAASVELETTPISRTTLMAGVTAEMLLGFELNPTRAAKDMTLAAQVAVDPNAPSPRGLLLAHSAALDALRDWFTAARQSRATIPGTEVHDFLAEKGCIFDSRRTDTWT